MHAWINCINEWMNEWMTEWMNEWMNILTEGMNKWTCDWMDELTHYHQSKAGRQGGRRTTITKAAPITGENRRGNDIKKHQHTKRKSIGRSFTAACIHKYIHTVQTRTTTVPFITSWFDLGNARTRLHSIAGHDLFFYGPLTSWCEENSTWRGRGRRRLSSKKKTTARQDATHFFYVTNSWNEENTTSSVVCTNKKN